MNKKIAMLFLGGGSKLAMASSELLLLNPTSL